MVSHRRNRLGQPDGRRILDDRIVSPGEVRSSLRWVERCERAVDIRVEHRILVGAVVVTTRCEGAHRSPGAAHAPRARLRVPLYDCRIEDPLSLFLDQYREVEPLDVDLHTCLPELLLKQHRQPNTRKTRGW